MRVCWAVFTYGDGMHWPVWDLLDGPAICEVVCLCVFVFCCILCQHGFQTALDFGCGNGLLLCRAHDPGPAGVQEVVLGSSRRNN